MKEIKFKPPKAKVATCFKLTGDNITFLDNVAKAEPQVRKQDIVNSALYVYRVFANAVGHELYEREEDVPQIKVIRNIKNGDRDEKC